LYASALLAPWIAPYHYAVQSRDYPNCPPSPIRVHAPSRWASDGMLYTRTLRLVPGPGRVYAAAGDEVPLAWFTRGVLLTTARPQDHGFFLGTDGLGRATVSRIVYGGRISLTVGAVGVAISFVIGIVLGAIAGY